jgi:predicted RNA-binding protein with RPS1 domain
LAVSNLDMHALFVLGDLRAKLVKQFQGRFVYITEQTAEGIYIAEIDTQEALVVDDKQRLELKVGDHFRAAVLPSREGGKLELKFREIKLTVYGLGDYAFVESAEGSGILLKEGQTVVMVFAAHEQLQGALSKTLKDVSKKAAKWRKGELTFKASE